MGPAAKNSGSLRPAIFLDRDGTVVYDRDHLADPERLELLPGAAEGLRRLAALGYVFVVVTNQSGVARGYFTLGDVDQMNARLTALLEAEGIQLDGIYVCPHGPEDGCDCRKPLPGLLLRAARELGLDLGRSLLIGDRDSDMKAAEAAGIRGILVERNGPSTLIDVAATLG
jgi:D-glycero-D-manno-heptose 1,7-bisphosphate phosphatase